MVAGRKRRPVVGRHRHKGIFQTGGPRPPPRPSPRSHPEQPWQILAHDRHPERQIAVYALQLIEPEPPAAAAIPETPALTTLNPNYQGNPSCTAGREQTALLTAFCRHLFSFNQNPGKARTAAEAKAHGRHLAGWACTDQFVFWTREYRFRQPAPLPPEQSGQAFAAECRETLLDYAMFLINSGGCRPTA